MLESIFGKTIFFNSSLLMAVKIVPLQPFLSCSCPTLIFKKISNISELILLELITKNPVEHKAFVQFSVMRATLSSEPSTEETITSPFCTFRRAREGSSLPKFSV